MSEILTDLFVVAGVETFEELKPDNLNKRHVTKERFCQWLCVFANMMNRLAYPNLQMVLERVQNSIPNYWKKGKPSLSSRVQ
jgi:hypothetical protein